VATEAPPNVFEYLDYRSYLGALYRHRKATQHGFSYRAFARRAGCRSPNFLKLIIDGKRNLSLPMASRFAKACNLGGEDAEYFATLVGFSNGRTLDERNTYFHQLTSFRQAAAFHKLQRAQAAYHSRWYLPAVRELCGLPSFKGDPAWIARTLRPRISTPQAREALQLLSELRLIRKSPRGHWVQTDAVVTTGTETKNLHIANYHRAMLQRAGEALELFAPEARDISGVTLRLSPAGLTRVKRRVQRFRQELIELSLADPSPTLIAQVNLQLFPLTDPESESDA